MGVAKIIEYSIRDESLHAEAGCWLFNTLVREYPEILTEEVKEQIYDAARLTVKLEDDFIDQAFALGPIESIDHEELKIYIRFRTNTKLKDIGLQPLYKNIDKERIKPLVKWFNALSAGQASQDFFAANDANYAKSLADFSGVRQKLIKGTK